MGDVPGTLIRLAFLVAVGLGVAQPSLPTTASVDVDLTATALILSGNDYPFISDEGMAAILHGKFADDTRVNVYWPAQTWPESGWGSLTLGQSISTGVDNLDEAIRSTPGTKVAAGISGGSQVVDEEMRRLATDPNAPPPEQLSFVVIGDANRSMLRTLGGIYLPFLNYVPTVPETPYDVTVVAGEYDGFGDWPDRSWNLLADLNAIVGTGTIPGFHSVHYDSLWADLSQVPARNVTTTTNSKGGVTTTYVIPTANLPLLQPLRDIGVPSEVVDSLNAALKPIVDAAYVRNDSANKVVPPRHPRASAAAASRATSSSKAAHRDRTATAGPRRAARRT
jgi:hypothetical protein